MKLIASDSKTDLTSDIFVFSKTKNDIFEVRLAIAMSGDKAFRAIFSIT